MTDTTKNIVMGIIIIVVLFAAFKLLVPKKEDAEVSPTVNTAVVNTNIKISSATREAALTLQKIKSIEVDTEVFSDKTFKSLKDFRVNILPEDVGRDNPFAPIR